MKDLSIDIVKDNKYFLKSPFNGQLVLFYVEENDYVKKDQTVAVMKTDHGYIDVESDFSGIVSKVNVKLNDDVEKWQDLIVVEVKDDAASDYDIIYTFQQEAFPRFIYNDTAKILMGLAHEEGEFVFYILSMFYENYGTETKNDTEIASQVQNIKELEAEINKLKNQIAFMKNKILCKSCGNQNEVGSLYCAKCGENLKKEGTPIVEDKTNEDDDFVEFDD